MSITDAVASTKRVVKGHYQGPKLDGVPHGLGVLVTEVVYYKGEFAYGKFHGAGFLRRYGAPGTASPAHAPSPAGQGRLGAMSPMGSTPASPMARPRSAGAAAATLASSPMSPRPVSAAMTGRATVVPPAALANQPGAGSDSGSPSPGLSSPKAAGAVPRHVAPKGTRLAVWTYIGQFYEGKRHGHGKILFHSTGEGYEGDWYHDEMRGRGVYTLPSGIYSGEMFSNRRHGIGSMVYIDGSGYRGNWQQDVIHGAGRLVEPDGTYFDGHWTRGVMNGIFHMTKPSGSVYRRQYLDGRKVTDEKRKGRDLYSMLFEAAPAKLTVEERLAQVFPLKPQAPQPLVTDGQDSATDGAGPSSVEGDLGAVFSPRTRRPGSANDVPGARHAGGDTGDANAIDFEDFDADDDDGAASPRSQATALLRRRSTLRPLSELGGDLLPRRPYSAGARPSSAGDSDDDTHSPCGTKATPGVAGKVLERYGHSFSPNSTLVTDEANGETMSAQANGSMRVDTGFVSPRNDGAQVQNEMLQRFTMALAEVAEKMGDAPVPEGVPQTHDEWLEDFKRKRAEAEMDRKASAILERHDTMRRANTGLSLASRTPKSTAQAPARTGVAPSPLAPPAPAPSAVRTPSDTTELSFDPAFGPALGSFVSVPNTSLVGAQMFGGFNASYSTHTEESPDSHRPVLQSPHGRDAVSLPPALQLLQPPLDGGAGGGDDTQPKLPSTQAPDHLLMRLAELSMSPPSVAADSDGSASPMRRRGRSVKFSPHHQSDDTADQQTAPTPVAAALPRTAKPLISSSSGAGGADNGDTPRFGRRSTLA